MASGIVRESCDLRQIRYLMSALRRLINLLRFSFQFNNLCPPADRPTVFLVLMWCYFCIFRPLSVSRISNFTPYAFVSAAFVGE